MLLLAMLAFQAAPVPQTANDKDPVICTRQNVGTEVGTHMRPKKVCMKKSEWDLIEAHTKETLQSINGRGNNPGRADGHRLNNE
ncbi:hypothetical protein [Sphingomonas flavescens]|jgi:hypothetical protein|uniref:hypothetical protein n=1 Tax=Sphingomonas flavescens TaxID=3132797 RepID=UPI0028051FB1|nr:hypothetical protein [Sphingomonas limnosediminicola]